MWLCVAALPLLTPASSRAQDTSVLCSELGECAGTWISELGFAFGLDATGTSSDFNLTWEFGLLQPMSDRRTGLGGTTIVGFDMSGDTRFGLKARQRTQFEKVLLDIGIGALLYDSRGGLGATAHLGVGINRHLSVRLAVDIVDRQGGAAVFPYAGINLAKVSGRLSPVEGVLGALTPLLAVAIGEFF